MKLPIVGVRQIKLPVSDLVRSARCYSDLFGLALPAEFYEDSAVRGVVLADHAAGSHTGPPGTFVGVEFGGGPPTSMTRRDSASDSGRCC